MICITTKSKAGITARALGRRGLSRRCGFYFRRTDRGGSPNRPRAIEVNRPYLLKKLAVDLKDAGEAAGKFPIFLIIKLALHRQPFQMARRVWMIRIINQIMIDSLGR